MNAAATTPEALLAQPEGEKIRPTPEFIDELARRYQDSKDKARSAAELASQIEAEAVALVTEWGIVPAHAEKSRRLAGRLAELTVTRSDTITINAERVEMLRDMLEANDERDIFPKLFAVQTKYEIVDGAESVLKSVDLGKRLSEKVLNFFGRCITPKPKKPSLKVTIADPTKPAKKPRAKKGSQQ